MRYTGLLTSSASGKAGGILPTGATGDIYASEHPSKYAIERADSPPHELRRITSELRSLTDAQRAAWAQEATGKKSGYTLYGSRNLNLFDLGLTPNLTTRAPAAPVPGHPEPHRHPHLHDGYTSANADGFLSQPHWPAQPPPPPAWAPHPPTARHAHSPAEAIYAPSRSSRRVRCPWSNPCPHGKPYRHLPTAGTITFEMDFIDPASGAKSPAVKCTASYTAIGPVAPATRAIAAYLPSGEVAVINAPAIYVNTDLAAVAP